MKWIHRFVLTAIIVSLLCFPYLIGASRYATARSQFWSLCKSKPPNVSAAPECYRDSKLYTLHRVSSPLALVSPYVAPFSKAFARIFDCESGTHFSLDGIYMGCEQMLSQIDDLDRECSGCTTVVTMNGGV